MRLPHFLKYINTSILSLVSGYGPCAYIGTRVRGAQGSGALPERHEDGGAAAAQAGERGGDRGHRGGVLTGDGCGDDEGDLRGDVAAAAGGVHVPEHVQDHLRVHHLRLRHAPIRRGRPVRGGRRPDGGGGDEHPHHRLPPIRQREGLLSQLSATHKAHQQLPEKPRHGRQCRVLH